MISPECLVDYNGREILPCAYCGKPVIWMHIDPVNKWVPCYPGTNHDALFSEAIHLCDKPQYKHIVAV